MGNLNGSATVLNMWGSGEGGRGANSSRLEELIKSHELAESAIFLYPISCIFCL